MSQKNWADSKLSVNSVNPSHDEGDTEPRQRSTREGVETRHGATQQLCYVCQVEKPLSEFYRRSETGKSRTRCKACQIDQQRERLLGVSPEQYWDMYHKQNGQCGICLRRLYSKRYKAFCVDHNHSTGQIRGLLCHNCNRAIGMLRDDPTALRRAVDWVEGIVQSSQ